VCNGGRGGAELDGFRAFRLQGNKWPHPGLWLTVPSATYPSSILSRNASMYCRPIGETHRLSKYLDATALVSFSLKGLSQEMGLSFDNMRFVGAPMFL
jgi:hypothetical protein